MATIYRKYRPQIFSEVFGQDHVIETLTKALDQDRLAHAYLFTGARGVGKTTVARLLAKAVNCVAEDPSQKRPCGKCQNCLSISKNKFIDLIEIDAASNRGIDEIRELRDKIQFAPSIGKKRVYIIDEVHMLTREAFNALLKTLEEPPEHTIFIFATTEAHKVPVTVMSRCQRFDFRLADDKLIKESLRKVAKAEKLKASSEIIDLLAASSGGSFRDSQSLLDQLSPHLIEHELTLEEALKVLNLSSVKEVIELIEHLKNKKAPEAIRLIEKLKSSGINFPDFLAMLIIEIRRELIEQIKAGSESSWQSKTLRRLIEAQAELKVSPVESLPLELAVYEVCFADQNNQERVKNDQEENVENKQEPVSPKIKKPEGKPLPKDLKMAIVDEVTKRKKTLGSLLETCSIEKDEEDIKIMTEYPFHKETIIREKNLLLIEEAVDTILGRKAKVACVVRKDDLEDEINSVFGGF